jgi:energy-coupling factor transporter ATP-binding protein EcfA2
MADVHIQSLRFRNFKAFVDFSIPIQHTNILVGPNNSGKSTVLSAFRALAAGLRRARAKSPEVVRGPGKRDVHGYNISPDSLPLSLENVHTEYQDTDSSIEFLLSNKNKLILFFPRDGGCSLIPLASKSITSAATFKTAYPIMITAVPILGPIEHVEELILRETVNRNLLSHRASGNFRNFWHHYPERFDQFSALVEETWPGMEIEPTNLDTADSKLTMFYKENRKTRELFWAGYGFQAWCQLLTHIVHAQDHSLLMVDEAEIYLHPEVQRQLVSIIRSLNADVVLATHSTEIMAEADPSEIVIVDKASKAAVRVKDAIGVQQALDAMGSIHNLSLSELARNRRIIFIEGSNDLRIIRGFAARAGFTELSSGRGISTLESDGFAAWKRIRDFAWGLKKAIKDPPKIAAIFDRDYFSKEETDSIEAELKAATEFCHVHGRKEIENYLLDSDVIDRTIAHLLEERAKRTGTKVPSKVPAAKDFLLLLSEDMKTSTQAQVAAKRWEYQRSSGKDQAIVLAEVIAEFDRDWSSLTYRIRKVSGKELFQRLVAKINTEFAITLTPARILLQFKKSEIPKGMEVLLGKLEKFLK